MSQFVFDTDASPIITVERVGGDLRLSGWEQNQFHAESTDDDPLHAEQRNGGVFLAADADCTVHVPQRSTLKIAQVGGDAKIKHLEGGIEIKFVGGDLVLRQIGPTTIERVGGDLNAKKIAGPLVATAGGDASARGVSGDVTLKAGADLYLRDVSGSVKANAGSDAVLSTPLAPDKVYEVRAGSDLLCRVPPGTSATFTVKAGSDISVDALGAKIEGSPRQRTVTFGEGRAQVSLNAGSDVSLTMAVSDPESMAEFGAGIGIEYGPMAAEFASEIGAQIEAQMADLEKDIREKLAKIDLQFGEHSGIDAEKIARRTREAAERATEAPRHKAEAIRRKAEAKIEAVERRAERMADRAERQAGHANHTGHGDRARRKTGAFTFKFDAGRASFAPPPVAAVSDEERMAVLKMLEQGKITVGEAEKLLAALEGEIK